MSSINDVEKKLIEIDATKYHKLVDRYLNKKFSYIIHSTGTKLGEDKPVKGTPDSLVALDNGHYVFIEYTTQETGIVKKFKEDMDKCLNESKTGISTTKIDKIILAINRALNTDEIEALKNHWFEPDKCEIITNSSLAIELYNHYPIILKEELNIDIGNVLIPEILSTYYKENFDTISFLIDENQKPIDDIFINLSIIKEDEKQKEESIAIDELISTSKKSLIYGKAGIGKTALCRYVAYKWANGEIYQEFDFLIYIPLRQWKSDRLKEVMRSIYTSQNKDEVTLDVENNDKILFLFDGYDELQSDKKVEFKKAIRDSKLTHYIITSRPYGYQRNEFEVDEHFETIGFTDENVEEYIKRFFDNTVQYQQLQAFLDSNIAIKQILYIPLMLEMICTLWQEKAQNNQTLSSPMTMTELYSDVVKYILEEHSKNKDDESVYEWENREEIKELLGKIAFEGLRQQSILFDGIFIQNTIGKDKLDFFKTSTINSGFLKSDRKDKSLLGNNFEFPHLTFQEYFSAHYVSQLSQDEQKEIIKEYKFYPHFKVFFAFLAGLIEDKEFLLGEIENEPREITGYYTLSLQISLLYEVTEKIEYIEIINDKIQIYILDILWFDINTEYFFERIKQFIPKISSQTLDFLVESILEDNPEESLDYFKKISLVNIIYSCYQNDNKHIQYLIYLSKTTDKKIQYYISLLLGDEEKSFDNIITELMSLDAEPYEVYETLKEISIYEQLDSKLGASIMKILNKHNINDIYQWCDYYDDCLSEKFLDIENNAYLSTLEEELKSLLIVDNNEDVSPTLYDECNYILELLKQDPQKVWEYLLPLIHNDEIDFYIRHIVIIDHYKYLIYTNENINYILDALENENIDPMIAQDITQYLLKGCINQSVSHNNRIINLLYNGIVNKWFYIDDKEYEDENNDQREEEFDLFLEINNDSNDYIDKLIIFVLFLGCDKYFTTSSAIKKLAQISNYNLYAFNRLYIFEDYFDTSSFLKYLNTSILFQAYDNNKNVGSYILSDIYNPKKVFYMKSNKLCTIENGKEIQTKRDIDDNLKKAINETIEENELDF